MTTLQVWSERDQAVMDAVANNDSEAMYQLAGLYKEEGYAEIAETLLENARKVDRDDWAYDIERDNNLA